MGDAWVDALKEDLEEHIVQEKKEYQEMIDKCNAAAAETPEEKNDGNETLGLQMTVRFLDGDEVMKCAKKYVLCEPYSVILLSVAL